MPLGKICSWLQLDLEILPEKAPSIIGISKCYDVSVHSNLECLLDLVPIFTL